ncbi:hypothetical protein ACVWWP_008345 [Bradyrhizobium sp. LM3.6]
MDTYDTMESDEHPMLGRLIKVGLFLLVQGIAVALVAFVALLVSFEPGWSATTEQASLLQPGDAKSGSLLLKEDGRLHRSDPPRHRRRHHGIGPDAALPRHSSLPQPDQRLGRGDLCLSAPHRRCRRYAEDGGRRPRHHRRHQGAAAGARDL